MELVDTTPGCTVSLVLEETVTVIFFVTCIFVWSPSLTRLNPRKGHQTIALMRGDSFRVTYRQSGQDWKLNIRIRGVELVDTVPGCTVLLVVEETVTVSFIRGMHFSVVT